MVVLLCHCRHVKGGCFVDKISIVPTSGPNTGQTQDPLQGKPYAGEWGVLRMFRETGGSDGRGAQFELTISGLRLSVQPKSGNVFERDQFTALRAPKSLQQGR